MKIKSLFFIALSLFFLLQSCSKDEDSSELTQINVVSFENSFTTNEFSSTPLTLHITYADPNITKLEKIAFSQSFSSSFKIIRIETNPNCNNKEIWRVTPIDNNKTCKTGCSDSNETAEVRVPENADIAVCDNPR